MFSSVGTKTLFKSKLMVYSMCIILATWMILFLAVWYTPTRNVFIGPLLPGPWLPIQTGQLIKMHQVSKPVDVGVCPQSCTHKYKPHVQREDLQKRNILFYDQLKYNSSVSSGNSWRFLPLMNRQEKTELLYTLDVMTEILTQVGLKFFLVDGTLLGLVRHHGVIPWDDDLDVAANGSEWQKFKDILCCVEGFMLYPQNIMHWKFFSTTAAVIRNSPQCRFPFIDIFFYMEDKDFLWSLTQYNIQNLLVKKTDVFPLTTGQLDGQEYPVPRRSHLIAKRQFKNWHMCASPRMFHRYNYALPAKDQVLIPCATLTDLYTFYLDL